MSSVAAAYNAVDNSRAVPGKILVAEAVTNIMVRCIARNAGEGTGDAIKRLETVEGIVGVRVWWHFGKGVSWAGIIGFGGLVISSGELTQLRE